MSSALTPTTDESIARAHDAGFAVWLWPNEHRFENEEAYADFLAMGVDGLNVNVPATGVAASSAYVNG